LGEADNPGMASTPEQNLKQVDAGDPREEDEINQPV